MNNNDNNHNNIKRVLGYKETDPDQFMDNYPDNRVSVPSLIITMFIDIINYYIYSNY